MVGTDIIEVARIEKLIEQKGDKFLNKIYSQTEIEYCESKGPNKYQHYAGRFAAKEALYKINGRFFNKIPYKSIEIWNNLHGEPYVVLPRKHTTTPKMKSFIDKLYGYDVSDDDPSSPRYTSWLIFKISISHVKDYAIAVATLGGNPLYDGFFDD